MSDPVVEEVRSARRARFSSFGNDLDRYCAKLRESAEKAKSMGVSFVEYCRNFSALETAAV